LQRKAAVFSSGTMPGYTTLIYNRFNIRGIECYCCWWSYYRWCIRIIITTPLQDSIAKAKTKAEQIAFIFFMANKSIGLINKNLEPKSYNHTYSHNTTFWIIRHLYSKQGKHPMGVLYKIMKYF